MSKGLESFKRLVGWFGLPTETTPRQICYNDKELVEKELKALGILIKWYQPDIIHDLCCFGASDEEINLIKEVLNNE